MSVSKEKMLETWNDLLAFYLNWHPAPYIDDECCEAIRALIIRPAPTVTEEWVEEKTEYIAEHPSYHRLEVVLREAGVTVEEGK